MSNSVKVTINGKEVQVGAGTTIRKACEDSGLKIPTFCYDDRLKPFSSCFLCVVEVEGARGMTPSCSTLVTEGMKIKTESQKVLDTRKTCLDLILSDHAGDCIAPCEATCPSNVDIQGYIAHVSQGNFAAATKLIKEQNPLPVVCGRICPHPCESQCRRALVDEPVAINPIKRFASEYELAHGPYVPPVGAETGKKVAIIGGGPAGLSAAYYLRQKGHAATIYEGLPHLGGMTRYGIPSFRLPWDLMDAEIKAITDLGVKVVHGQWLGKQLSIEGLKKSGYDAVLLAIGAHKSKAMWIDNEDSTGVLGGIDFLREVVLKNDTGVGPDSKVAVIGGGDTAMDCARVAIRLGAKVELLYRRSQEEMPALHHEQIETMEEGVRFRFLTAPLAVVADANKKVTGLKCVTMELGEPDASGRRRPVPVAGSEEVLEYTHIIAAIGQDPDVSCVDADSMRPEVTKWKTFVYDTSNMSTSTQGVFTAGDCAFGPDTVIRAISEGKQAAKAMDLYFSGAPVKLTRPYEITRGRVEDLNMADYAPRFVHAMRNKETTFEAPKRLANGGYAPINQGFSEMQVLAEASRCIECGCNARFNGALRDQATIYGAHHHNLDGERRKYAEDKRHPFIKIEADKCITCGSCVRMCDEVRQISALTFVNRGFSTKITPNFGDPLQTVGCDSCGMCIDVCPTGAMAANVGKEVGPWFTVSKVTTCTACAKGCAIRVHVRDGKITKVESVVEDPINGGTICLDGRFSYQLLGQTQGLDSAQLASAKKAFAEAKSVAVLTTAATTLENLFAAYKLAQAKGGKLYYLSAVARPQSDRPHAKSAGKQNLSLLKKLGAQPWDNQAVDLLLAVGQDPGAHKANLVISLGVLAGAQIQLPLADPLKSKGTFLTESGDLAQLNSLLSEDQGFLILAQIGGLPGLNSLDQVRHALAQEVKELAGLTQLNGARLVPSGLAPLIADLAPDSRELAFTHYVATKGL